MADPLKPESANTKIVDGVVTHAVNILRVAADERQGVLDALTALEGELLGKIQAGGQTPFNAARTAALLAQTQGTISSAYSAIAASNAKALGKVATIEAAKTVNIVNDALQIPIATVGHSPEQLAKIGGNTMVNGRFPKEWWADQDQQLQNRFAAQVRLGMLNGEGVDDIVRRVRGTKAKAYTDGIMAVSKSQATALVRTGVQSAANEARIETLKKNSDVIKAIVWVSTLDARTTPICRALDGLQWSLPDLKPVGHDKAFPGAIAHWQCRSTQAPVTRSWAELAGPNSTLKTDVVDLQAAMEKRLIEQGMSEAEAAKVLVNQRASMDGTVPAGLTFDGWLGTKSTEFQNKILGTGKAALWRDGKLSLADMTNMDNRPLSLAQLHELVSANTDVAPAQEGEDGLSTAERSLLQDSMIHGVETGDTLTHYMDGDTGEHFVLVGTAPTTDEAAKIAGVKALTVIQNSKAKGTVWSPQQFRFFGSLPNFRKALMVGPNGRVLGATLKAGKVFDDAAAKDILAKFDAMKAVKTIPHTQHKFQSALAQNGTLKFSLTPEGTITVPAKTYNQVFTAGVKPAPFFDAEAHVATQAAQQAAAEATKATTEKAAQIEATAKAIAAKADLQAEARAAEVAASADSTAKRAQAYQAGIAADKAQAAADALAKQVEKKNAEAQAEIADVLANPKGQTLKAKALGKLMVSDPGMAPHEMLAKAKADAVVMQAKASQGAALSGYKQKVLGGMQPTPAQLKAFQALAAGEQEAFTNALEAQKLALAKQTAEATAAQAKIVHASAEAVAAEAPAVPLPAVATKPIPIPEGFPEDPENLKVVKGLGGSTGAELVQDKQGGLWVRKRGNSADHLREEVIADQLYRGMGVPTPDSRLYDRPTGPVKLSRYLPGTKTLNEYLATATAPQRAAVVARIQKHFAADALIANWDVLGQNLDNILIDHEGNAWRIDNGGALRYRAQGQPKGKDWNEHPAEPWTMRAKYSTPDLVALQQAIPAGVQKQFKQVFGDVGFFDLARQIEAIDPAVLAHVPDDLRPTLERRLANLKALSVRALDFEHSKWAEGFTDNMARASMELRERGVVDRLVPKFAATPGSTTMVDSKGKIADELRTSGQNGHKPVNPADPHAANFLQAIISINANATKATGTFANPAKLKIIKDSWTALTLAASKGDAQAKYYLGWIDKIEAAEKQFKAGKLATGKAVLPMFDSAAGAKLAPNLPAAKVLKPAGSITQDVAAYIKTIGGDPQAINAWMGSQAGSSWHHQARAMKYFIATEKTAAKDTFFWGSGGIKASKAQFDALSHVIPGGEKAVRDTYTAWIAYTQEIFATTAMPNSDQARRVVRLIRTEEDVVMESNGIPLKKYGGVHVMPKGNNESHSIMAPTFVHGKEVTVQAVPWSDVTGLYLTDRPAGGGTGEPAFAGEGENEFTANSSGIPFVYAGKAGNLTGAWAKLLAHGYDAGNDATKWGVPIDHLRK